MRQKRKKKGGQASVVSFTQCSRLAAFDEACQKKEGGKKKKPATAGGVPHLEIDERVEAPAPGPIGLPPFQKKKKEKKERKGKEKSESLQPRPDPLLNEHTHAFLQRSG